MSVEQVTVTAAAGLEVSVGRTVARLGRQVELALARVDLTIAQYRVLTQLTEGAEASSSLAAKLAVSRPSITAVVEGLVERGLVDRRHSAADRRRVSVSLTGAGEQAVASGDAAVSAKLAGVLTAVGDGQAAQAIAGIACWGAAMDENKARKQAAAPAAEPAVTS